MSEPMTDAKLKLLEKDANAAANDGQDDAWWAGQSHVLIQEVKRVREENRKLQVEAIDWESRVRSEREACAKVAEKYLSGAIGIRDAETYDRDEMLEEIAAAIRARGGA